MNTMPTISYGSILQMNVVKMTMNYVMKLNSNVTPLLESDYDGDTLNVVYITNKAFYEACAMVFNPRNSMQISHNDGKFNTDILFSKDSMINANSMIYLSRKRYTKEQLDNIKKAKEMD